MRLKLLYFILNVLLINSCCRKSECKCNEEWGVKVSDCTPKHYGPYYLGEVKDYLYFKKGSWWVYKNNLSGETDSIYTVYCDTFMINSTGDHYKWLSMSYSDIGFRLRSDKYDVNYIYSHGVVYPDVTGYTGGIGYTMDKTSNFPTISRVSTPFTYPFKVDNRNLFQELIPSMTIQGKTYNDVAVFQVWSDETVQLPTLTFGFMADAPTKYYWAKGVGLVMIEQTLFRFDLQQTFVQKWELIKYNLIK
jgi:hypothetical protein